MRYTDLEKKYKAIYNVFRSDVKDLNKEDDKQLLYLASYLNNLVDYMHNFYNENIANETDFLIIDVRLYSCMYYLRQNISNALETYPKDINGNMHLYKAKLMLCSWQNTIDSAFNPETMEKLRKSF